MAPATALMPSLLGKRHEDPKGAEGALLERRMQLHSRAELNPLRCTLLGICGAFPVPNLKHLRFPVPNLKHPRQSLLAY